MSGRDAARVPIAAAVLGSLAIAVASFAAALVYTGRAGEPYSPLNHWVSELGEIGVSRLAVVFDLGLIVGGLCFAVFMLGLARSRTGRLRLAYGPVGVVAGAAGFLVGVFPMNQPAVHRIVALTFFNLGWIAVGLASLDFIRRPDPRTPPWLAIVGALTVLAFLGFLAAIPLDPRVSTTDLASSADRPVAWGVTILEWAVVAGIVAWTFLTGITWWRALRSTRDLAAAEAA